MNDINEIRKEFPVTENLKYFDHAAIAPLHRRTLEAINEYTGYFSKYGIKNFEIWVEKIEAVRQKLADLINATPEEIAFTKSTSAGLSVFANGIEFKNGDNILIPDIEFPSNVYPWLNLERKGVKVNFIKTYNGILDENSIEALIDENTRVVSISWVQFSSGYKADLAKISQIIAEKSRQFGRKIYFCVDAIQGLGALKLDVQEVKIDFLSADGHKWLLSTEGAGFIYCNKEILPEVHPSTVGWKSVKNPLDFTKIDFDLQETAAKFEEGSMNLCGILAMGASLDIIDTYGLDFIENRIVSLNNFACQKIKEKGLELLTTEESSQKSGIICFRTPDVTKDYQKLTEKGVILSLRGDFLRISPHFYNTEEEIEFLFQNL